MNPGFTLPCSGIRSAKKVIEDGKEIRRNVIDDEIVVAAPDAGSFTRAKIPQLADAKVLKQSGFFTRLRFAAEAAAYREAWPGHDGGVVLIWEGKPVAGKVACLMPGVSAPAR